MKKVLVWYFILISALFAQSLQIDRMLKTIEQVDFTKIMNFQLQHTRFNRAQINARVSASQLYKRMASQHKTIVFRDMVVSDSLVFNRGNCKVERLVFVNCLFPKSVTLENSAISSHLAFMGCRFEDDIRLERISCRNVSFLSNAITKQLFLTEDFGEDRIGQLSFVFNNIARLNIESFNAHGNVTYTGKMYFDNISFFSNKIDFVRISGAYCKNMLIFFGNILKRIELDDIKLDYLLGMKFNVMDSCLIINCMNKENALVSLGNNSNKHLTVSNNTLRFISLSHNYLQNTSFTNLKIFLSFQLKGNLFRKNSRINLKDSDFAIISYTEPSDSILVAVCDTSLQQNPRHKVPFLGTAAQFPIQDSTGQPQFVRLNMKWILFKKTNKHFAFNFDNVSIDEKNWHIHFNNIRKRGNFYRINPQDSVLAGRHEVYTAIYNAYRRQGKWAQADDCYYEWKQFERQNYWALSDESFFYKLPKTLFNYLNWISCGYGIKPLRIFPFAVLVVFVFALFYFFTPEPISNLEQHLVSEDKIKKALNKLSPAALEARFEDFDFNFKQHKQALIDDIVSSMDKEQLSALLEIRSHSRFNFDYLWNCIYFSFSTFTTVGLGDWYPTGNLNRAIVMIEGSLGWLSLGLFITTYANVLLR